MIKKITFTVFLFVLLLTGCGQRGPNIILVVVDALRADHLGCYGYSRDTSPFIDSLANAGTRWSNAQAQAPWTLPGCASILTGLTVRSHGARQTVTDLYPLSGDIPTAASLMAEGGYYTTGIVNGYWVGPELGFDAGFQSFSYEDNGNRKAAVSVDNLTGQLGALGSDQSFFALLHLYDAHSPYDPPDEFAGIWTFCAGTGPKYWFVDQETGELLDPENRQRYINLYDGEIRWIDNELGRLFAWLRESGMAENTIVIITADHGEEFLDHGWIEHSVTLYQELLHVPLIISGPGIPSGTIDSTLVGQIDILPTILELALLDLPDHLEGVSLLPAGSNPGRVIPSGGPTPDHWHPDGLCNRNWVSVRQGNTKLIWDADADTAVTYDLSLDPGEHNPIPVDSILLEEALTYWSTPRLFPLPESVRPGDDVLRLLKGLGYM